MTTKHPIYKFFYLSAFVLFSSFAFGQEICNNDIDDDGDGFVDCFDRDCKGAANCQDDYIDGTPACEVVPSQFPTFEMKLLFKSFTKKAGSDMRLSVGDIDGDGFPEIISPNYYTGYLFVLDGRDGKVKDSIDIGAKSLGETAIADIDRDGKAEIFVPYRTGILALKHDLTDLWSKTYRPRFSAGSIGLADFDGDSLVELYSRDMIIDAHTGTLLNPSKYGLSPNNPKFIEKHVAKGGVAVDILADSECTNCQGLELVVGGLIFSVKIDRVTNSAQVKLEKTMPGGYRTTSHGNSLNRSYSSIADYNQDGFLDVITTGNHPTDLHTTIYFWDVKNNNVLSYHDESIRKFDNISSIKGWHNGCGRPNISDIDGDGKLNITFNSGVYLYALNDDMTLKWREKIVEYSSGNTGATVFDFNGDGTNEIVYRDEKHLYIINGKNGNAFSKIDCRSITWTEYPIVADVNGDGATEICVTCRTNYKGGNDTNSEVRVFGAKDDLWVPARRVWNQHAYFNVNINDDLTIPRRQQQHHLVWSTNTCGNPNNRPLNSFLNQSPHLTYDGCPNYAASDLKFAKGITVKQPKCPDTDFKISFKIINDGDKNVEANIPISFYDGDPLAAGATYLNTVYRTVKIPKKNPSIKPPNNFVEVKDLIVKGPGTAFTLYIALNHDGVKGKNNNPPTPIGYPSGGVLECKNDNNVASVNIIPTTFKVSAEPIKDNENCDPNNKTTSNGVAQAFVLINGVKVTAGYEFYWYNSPKPVNKAIDFSPGPIYSNLAKGTYSVTASNNNKKCSSDTVEVVIETKPTVTTHQVRIDTVQSFSDCKNPNGSLRADVYEGSTLVTNPTTKYSFAWYLGIQPINANKVSTDRTATGLKNKEYLVVVTDKTTNCSNSASRTVPNATTFPVVSAVFPQPLTHCSTTSSEASASVNGKTKGYTFNWYIGANVKTRPDYTGAKQTNLPAGEYTVTATDNNTNCPSEPVTGKIEINTTQPNLNVKIDSDNTSCDANKSNGSVSADVDGVTAGYTFRWYKGQSTNSGDELPGSPSPSLKGLAGGTYTVEVTQNSTNCKNKKEVTISVTNTKPVVSPKATATQSICTAGVANGEVTADVAGTTNGYKFYWFDGDQTGRTLDINNANFTGHTYKGRTAGDYTVIAVNDNTNCASDPAKTTVADNTVTTTPTISTRLTHMTACDKNSKNGQIETSVTAGGNTADFDFFVYKGQNTLATNKVTATAPPTTFGKLDAGTYTIVAKHKRTGCSNKVERLIKNEAKLPVISATPSNITDCNPNNGSIEAKVDIGNVNDYTFSWYKGKVVKAKTDFTETGNVLRNLSEGIYTVEAIHKTRKCKTQNAVSVTISKDPSAKITIRIDNSQRIIPADCNKNSGRLGVIASSPGNTRGFTFTWHTGDKQTGMKAIGSGKNLNTPPTRNNAENLKSGVYTVIARDNNTRCQDSLTIDLPFNDEHTFLNVITKDNTHCTTANGSFTTEVKPGAAALALTPPADQKSYRIEVWQNQIMIRSKKGTNSRTLIQNLEPGNYTVKAIEIDPRLNGCSSASRNITIGNKIIPPVIALGKKTNNTFCSTTGNGSISLKIDGVNTPAIGYKYVWYKGKVRETKNKLPSAHTPAPGHTAINLKGGLYTVEVRKNANDCPAVMTFHIMDKPPTISIIQLTKKDNNNCSPPNGSAEVTGITPDNLTDYTYQWLQSNGTSTITGSGTGVSSPTNLNGGTRGGAGVKYFVKAKHNTNACVSPLKEFVIHNKSAIPAIKLKKAIEANTICGTTYNGSIQIEIVGAQLPLNTNYTITWVNATTNTPVPAASVSTDKLTISQVPAGKYKVTVTDRLTPNQACTNSATYTVPDKKANITIDLTTDVASKPNDRCTAPFIGEITVNQVKEDGVAKPANTGYTFVWMDKDKNVITGVTGNIITALKGGIYYVTVRNNNTQCTNLVPIQVEVKDNAKKPVITLEDSTDPEKCNGPNKTGMLSVTADDKITGYTFVWHKNNVEVGRTATIRNLTAGTYTVTVTNTTTRCSDKKTYTLTEKTFPIVVNASTSPVTNCSVANGSVFAKVTTASGDFEYFWFNGNKTNPAPDLNNLGSDFITPQAQEKKNLKTGKYTVVARATYDNDCKSDPVVTEIEKKITYPKVEIKEDAALSYCDRLRPNGQLSATADGGKVSGYTFEWFNGKSTTGTPASKGSVYGQLTAGVDYTVKVTNILTGCQVEATKQVTEKFPNINSPIVKVLSHRTSCSEPNGSLIASVDGKTDGYRFKWYLGTNTNAKPIGVFPKITDLDIGIYTVVATHIITGCKASNTGEILDKRIKPKFKVKTTPASCGQPNGSIQVTSENTLIESIEWEIDGRKFKSLNLDNHKAGKYKFTVYSNEGCKASGEATILEDIIIYNGVSSNNDGKNDHFIISCIEIFENNNVKIYNRAGQIVYEADGYNNDNVKFDGKGNKGIYLTGNDVPDGTYFYIVDKKDGSEPRTGYLELLR